jgi:hypothetical protein
MRGMSERGVDGRTARERITERFRCFAGLSATRWLAASFAVLSVLSLSVPPYGPARGGFSDHYAHMNAARLFPRMRTKFWTTPIDDFVPVASDSQTRLAPADLQGLGGLRAVPGWPVDKPFVGGWTHIAQPYPPGEILLMAPLALAYHFTALSFTMVCHALILWFLLASHAALWLVLRNTPEQGRAFYLGCALAAFGYVVFWTLRGFYDAAAMAPAIWAGACIGRRRWLAACVALSCAFFIHFRAMFYLPWALLAVTELLQARAWRSWEGREWVAVALAVALAASSAYTLILVSPTLGQLPLANPIHPGDVSVLPVTVFAVSACIAAGLFLREQAYFDGALLLWMTLMLISIRQLQMWHPFMLLPWVFAPARSTLVRFARVEWLVVLTVAVIL